MTDPMTPEQERQLAERMAEVCGLSLHHDGLMPDWYGGNFPGAMKWISASSWRPWEEPDQAEMVVKAMHEKGYSYSLCITASHTEAIFEQNADGVDWEHDFACVEGYNPSLAICLAAEKAVYGDG